MSGRLLVVTSPGEQRVALEQDGRLEDYAVWRPGAPDGVDERHVGRIEAVVPAMAGAFVALCDATGFLPDSEGARGRGVGDLLTLRITRAAQGGKGPRLRAEGAAAGPVRRLTVAPEAALRLAAAHPAARLVTADAGLVARLRPELGARISLAGRAEVEASPVWEAAAALGEPVMALPGGLRATISPTPALVAIDVDGGASTAERRGKAVSQAAANRAALPALAQAIRLRNLSGAILIDLAGLPAARRAALGPALQAALALDPLGPRLLGFTALGLAEIVRPRVRPPLHELLAGPHAAGLAGIARLVGERPERMALVGSPAVVAALQGDAAGLAAFREAAGCALVMRADPGLGGTSWRIEER